MKLTEEDLNIIKEFIDNYTIVQNAYNQYKTIYQSINKNALFQKYSKLNNTPNINYINNQIQKQYNQYPKTFLLTQFRALKNTINELEKYKKLKIEQKYIEMYSGNLSAYLEKRDKKEKPTKIYIPKEEQIEKDYYYNEQTTITQIYIRIKYIYDFYKKNNDSIYSINKEFIKKNIKFYEIFKQAICKYNEKNKKLINCLTMLLENAELKQKTK